jgi:CheY-like chemotaxis protein/tetratricopeptide (TPR) repeat protein
MDLEAELTALKNHDRNATLTERAELSCRLAKQLEKAGEYEAASEALSEFWPDRNRPPTLDDLDDESTKAALLLRIGALAGWLGGAHQSDGSQETAKNLITQSIEIFEELGESARPAEAHKDLAICYWREGSFDEARIHLSEALSWLKDEDSDLKAVILIWFGLVEADAGRLHEALRLYNDAAPLIDKSEDHAIKGTFHTQFGLVFRRLAAPENREDYLDRALIEYAAASFHFEQAGNERFLARVENNLGYLFFTIGKYTDAHSHLDRARHLFLKLKDRGTAAQVDDTRARTLLAEGHIAEAERLARSSVRVLERGDQQALLAEALTTQGVALARLGNDPRAKAVLERANEVAQKTGDLEGAGRAELSIIEELGNKLSLKELVAIYRSAIDLLRGSQDPSSGKRLINCAERLLDTLGQLQGENRNVPDNSWEGFSFKQYVRDGEKGVIEKALRDAGGSVTKAAHFLGFKHHQSLISLINSRHKELLKARSTVRRRRHHLFSHPRRSKKKVVTPTSLRTDQISILHVEDNELVARVIADTLSAEGMQVDSCMSGVTALKILKGKAHYDVIIVDNDLPGLNGLDLTRRTRRIAHRRDTPIIMLSGDDVEREAWRAGVDDFVHKPEGIDQISSRINRLLKERGRKLD